MSGYAPNIQKMNDRILAREMQCMQYLKSQQANIDRFRDLVDMDYLVEKRTLLAIQMNIDRLKSAYSSQILN